MKKMFTDENEAARYGWAKRDEGYDVIIRYLPKGKIAVIITKPTK